MTKKSSDFVQQTGALREALKALDLLNPPAVKAAAEISRQFEATRLGELLPASLSRPSPEFSGTAPGSSGVGEVRSGRGASGPAARQAVVSIVALGGFVRATRLHMRLTQQELADIAGVGRRFISELEAGKPTLEAGKVLQVCASVGMDLFVEAR